MLTASQDIDSFIERQRSQLNKQNARQSSNRPPPPAPIQAPQPPNNYQDRLDFRVARILEEPPPRVQPPAQPYYPSNQPAYASNDGFLDQQGPYENEPVAQQPYRRLSNENIDDNPAGFFKKFGTYDDKRSQLKDDLKREYNEYLQAQKRVPKSKSTSQLASPRATNNNNNNNRRVQNQPKGKVVAPWEKGDQKSNNNSSNAQSLQDLSMTRQEPPAVNRSRAFAAGRGHDEQYVRDREDYINELHAQIRELEARKHQLELQSSKLSAGPTSSIKRAHYHEDLNALNSLLAERLDQRNAVDIELAHILNRPPVSSSPTRIGSGMIPSLDMPVEAAYQNQSGPRYPQGNSRQPPPNRNDRRQPPTNSGFVIGQETDKEGEQAAKKRYQQELQAQIREAQMRKAQAKREKDEYDRKLDVDIQRYNYFGRSGGGAPMRDRDGNVVANLSDLRNPPQGSAPVPDFAAPTNRGYQNGSGPSSIANAPFYNGDQQSQPPYPPTSDRSGSPNHARGAMSNGIFGATKTEDQLAREERYKLDLKKQIEEKRQREAEEVARRRAEEERELAKHLEWQQQMERQAAEEAARKQEKENQDRLHHQQLQDELERQRQQEEIAARRKPKRVEKPPTPKQRETTDSPHYQTNYDDSELPAGPPVVENAYRSSSPPVPTLKNKGKKGKAKNNVPRRQSVDEAPPAFSPPPQPSTPLITDDDFIEPPPVEETQSLHGQQTYRKPPTPRQPEVTSARKKPPPAHVNRNRPSSNTGMPPRAASNLSLRSDGSDSEVLNRLEHLKRQLKDKEARLQEHVNRHQSDTISTHITDASKSSYQPPTGRKQSPAFILNPARVHHRDAPSPIDRSRRLIQADDDYEFKPSYFRDDTILMSGVTGGPNAAAGRIDSGPSRRRDSSDQLFGNNIEREASRRRYGYEPAGYFDGDDPTALANIELTRIAEQNEQRLKKLRDLENDDASLLDSNEVLERFQQKQRLQRGGSQTTLQDDAWFK